ncbi:beta/gamma crystallin family protein [Duganella sp. sic0402]|uniref:beta/gamma crystallin family protein n=1 Tax=Duganella sp. sic0402 TaxID=2854786 RepID=UPI001C44D57D|nr:beta/gamma crystallin family protein [Duganella sp. sic0402]MBV7536095.1 beta/gamma crystallin family protein [Duganella sp. sic0402]
MKTILSRLMKTTMLLSGATLLAASVHAGEVTLYTDDNFGGRSVTVRGATPDLVQQGFNDRASSVIVRSGTWELCEHAGFQGHCITLQRGEYRKLEGFNDVISSAREVGDRGGRDDRGPGWRGDRDDRGGGGGGGYGRREPIVLFAQANFGGRRAELPGDVRKLDDYDFNDRAGSVIVNEGRWELCEHANFGGRCIVLNPGRYEYLDDMNNRISSVRRLR